MGKYRVIQTLTQRSGGAMYCAFVVIKVPEDRPSEIIKLTFGPYGPFSVPGAMYWAGAVDDGVKAVLAQMMPVPELRLSQDTHIVAWDSEKHPNIDVPEIPALLTAVAQKIAESFGQPPAKNHIQ